MLSDFIQLLKEIDPNIGIEELADALWLAPYLDLPSKTGAEKSVQQEGSSGELASAALHGEDLTKQERSSFTQEQVLTDLRLPKITNQQQGGEPFRVPTSLVLNKQLDLSRALRPLKRTVSSRHQFEIDVAATVHQIASSLVDSKHTQPIWQPILRPAKTRWLDVHLVFDAGPSMVLWQRTAAELASLLQAQGMFRLFTTWSLTQNYKDGALGLYRGITSAVQETKPHAIKALASSGRQQLVLIVSDCVAPYWHDGTLAKTLTKLDPRSHVAVMQVLPRSLWRRTGLGTKVEYLKSSVGGAEGVSNRQLVVKTHRSPQDNSPPTGFHLPVITLKPYDIYRWSHLFTGGKNNWVSGAILPPIPKPERDSQYFHSIEAVETFDIFWSTASPDARRLAGYLAAVPILSLPLIHMVQRLMLPHTDLDILAEVYLSGLLVQRLQTPHTRTTGYMDNLRFDFRPELRDYLLETVRRDDALDVLETVQHQLSAFIDQQTGRPLDFLAVLSSPEQIGVSNLGGEGAVFASVTASILRALGGYDKVVSHLEQVTHHLVPIQPKPQADPLERPKHKGFDPYSKPQLDRSQEAAQVLSILRETVALSGDREKRARTKRILLINGAPGIGKTWFLGYLRHIIRLQEPSWHLLPVVAPSDPPGYDAADFIKVNPGFVHHTKILFKDINRALNLQIEFPDSGAGSDLQIAEWSGWLENTLKDQPPTPLVIFFDNLEQWIGTDNIAKFLNVAWKMLMRQHHMPCMVVCACRKSPPLYSPILSLVSQSLTIKGFQPADLAQLIDNKVSATHQDKILRIAGDNPWITQQLSYLATTDNNEGVGVPTQEQQRAIFDDIVSERLDPSLRDTLYELARSKPNGFYADDVSPETLQKLLHSTLITYGRETKHYLVDSVLTRLFNEGK